MLNKIRVTICGKEYALQTEEKPAYVAGLAKKLDKQIQDMANSSDNISVQAAAVLIALSAIDESNKANESIDNIRTQIKDYVDEAGRARLERDDAVKEVELLKVKITRLESDINLLKLKESI